MGVVDLAFASRFVAAACFCLLGGRLCLWLCRRYCPGSGRFSFIEPGSHCRRFYRCLSLRTLRRKSLRATRF